jgi:PadR family transcriptional regulator, regulatory protein AphA
VAPRSLSLTSYLVLGLIDRAGEATPYDLKQMATAVSGLWTLRHDQVYRETERLAGQGLLTEDREQHGRRRRRFRMTPAGRTALEKWLATPTNEFTELRDPGLLQLFLGAEPSALAELQLAVHEERLREYEELARSLPQETPAGVRLALESGLGHEREWVRFWRHLLSSVEQ